MHLKSEGVKKKNYSLPDFVRTNARRFPLSPPASTELRPPTGRPAGSAQIKENTERISRNTEKRIQTPHPFLGNNSRVRSSSTLGRATKRYFVVRPVVG